MDASAGKICVVRCIHEEDRKAWIQMSKKTHTNPLSKQEIEKLRKNPYVASVTTNTVRFTEAFKEQAYTQLDRITDHLATMTKQERIAWFRRSAYVQPLNFLREIDGTTYAVRAFFSEDARENITEKVQRIILKSDDNNKEV